MIESYLKKLQKIIEFQDARKESFYSALEALLEDFADRHLFNHKGVHLKKESNISQFLQNDFPQNYKSG